VFKLNKKGFTLVEILVVILIIGILFVAFLPKIDFAGDKARETTVKSDFRTFMMANEQLEKEQAGFKPGGRAENVKELNKLLDAGLKIGTDNTTSALEDPWKQPYEIEFITGGGTTERKIFVKSYGKTGKKDIPDFVLLTQYVDGQILSCTAGLNVNIGEDLSNIKDLDLTKANEYKKLNCFSGLSKGTTTGNPLS